MASGFWKIAPNRTGPDGKAAGGSFGDHSAISFYPSKNLTVYGDGGAVLTNDARPPQQITMLRNHGRKDKYLHEKIGFNLRFNEIQAAVGREQLKVLDNLNAGRRRVAQWYRRELANVKEIILPPADSPETESVYHMFVIRLENHDVRESLARYLREQGIETGIHYPVPNHLQPAVTDRFGKQPALAADGGIRQAHSQHSDVPVVGRIRGCRHLPARSNRFWRESLVGGDRPRRL